MKINYLVRKTFKAASPLEGVNSIGKELLKESFLVVQGDDGFLGILTPSDIVESHYQLVTDSIHHKPRVDCNQKVESVLELMQETGNYVLPVFEETQFIGVVTKDDILDYLVEYRHDLERTVTKHTEELSRVNKQLRAEIAERKKAEMAIQKTEQVWRDSFNSLEDIMLIIDKDYNIENINDNGLKLLGKSKEEVKGKRCYKIIHNKDAPAELCPFRKSLKTKAVESIDRYEEVFDRYFSIKSSPIFDENGEIVRFVALLSDITARKQAEEALRKSETQKKPSLMPRLTEFTSLTKVGESSG